MATKKETQITTRVRFSSTFVFVSLFRIFKKQSRLIPSDVPTAIGSTTSHPVDSEILVQGADPITAE